MEKIINILLGLLLLISCIFNVILVNRLDESIDAIVETKLTDIEPEIIFLDSLIYDTVYIEKTELVRLPIYHTDTVKQTDTVVAVDSVYVELPIEIKQFNDTLDYTAISFDLRGFQCEVDNLYLKSMKVPTIKEKALKKWGIGLGIGISYIERFRLVPTVGIYYKLF